MFILIYFLVVSISQYILNRRLSIDETNNESYMFDKKSSLILVSLFIMAIILQIIYKVVNLPFFWYACAIYGVRCISILLFFTAARYTKLVKQQEEMEQIYQIFQPLVDKKGVGLDFNNVPFKLGRK